MNALLQFAATEAVAQPSAKAAMVAFGLCVAALSLGWIGSSYMKALGRNPEAGKAAGQLIIVAAMVELTALLAFAAIFVVE